MPNTNSGISVIVCCFNSATKLPETIKHIFQQQFNNPWEVIIVDNASTDNTSEIAEKECSKYDATNTEYKIIQQTKPGLNYAREKGVQNAQYEYLVFCDDDNWLNNDYLSIAFDLITNNTSIGAIGCQCIAEPETNPLPDWFETYKNNYAVGKQARFSGDVTRRGYVWGAGLITTKTIFNKCVNNDFPYLLTDRLGNLLSSGGDTELCSRIILCGYKLYYDENLILKHFIPQNRLNKNYLDKLISGINAAHSQLSKYYNLIYIDSISGKQKLLNTLKCTSKLFLSLFTKKWDFNTEKQLFFIYTGVDLGVDKDLKMLKKFKNESVRSSAR